MKEVHPPDAPPSSLWGIRVTVIGDIVAVMERWAPSWTAESWDNTGLIAGSPETPANGVLVALDVTDTTLDHAIRHGYNLIISHHPPVFIPMKRFSGVDMASRVIRTAIRHDIALYVAHTSLDRAPGGVSFALADRLGLEGAAFLDRGGAAMAKFVTYVPPEHTDAVRDAAAAAGAGVIGEYEQCSFTFPGTGTYIPSERATPFAGAVENLSRESENRLEMVIPRALAWHVVAAARRVHPYEEMAYDLIPLDNPDPNHGYGVVGVLPEPLDAGSFARYVRDRLGASVVTVSPGRGGMVKRVAVLGGNGRKHIGIALAAEADAFVTSEIGHHNFIEYGRSLVLVDAGHRETELPVLASIRDRLAGSGFPFEQTPDIFIDDGDLITVA